MIFQLFTMLFPWFFPTIVIWEQLIPSMAMKSPSYPGHITLLHGRLAGGERALCVLRFALLVDDRDATIVGKSSEDMWETLTYSNL